MDTKNPNGQDTMAAPAPLKPEVQIALTVMDTMPMLNDDRRPFLDEVLNNNELLLAIKTLQTAFFATHTKLLNDRQLKADALISAQGRDIAALDVVIDEINKRYDKLYSAHKALKQKMAKKKGKK